MRKYSLHMAQTRERCAQFNKSSMRLFLFVITILLANNSFSQVVRDSTATKIEHKYNGPDSLKVVLDIQIDTSGTATSAIYQPKGSTTIDQKMIEAAKRRAVQIKYPRRRDPYTLRLSFSIKFPGEGKKPD